MGEEGEGCVKRSLLLGLFFICTALFSVFLAIEKVDRGKEDIVKIGRASCRERVYEAV